MNQKIKIMIISVPLLFLLAVLSAQVNLNPGQVITIQAEDASLSQADIESEHSGYTGSGYVNYVNESGGYIEWAVNVSSDGPASCVFVFANGGDNRPVDIAVNGSIVTSYTFPGTGDWASWTSANLVVYLYNGYNTIRLTSTGSEGGPNIDRMDITFNGSGSSSDPPGDVNGDGTINIVDALLIAQYYVGLNPSPFDQVAADVNCDNNANIVDALLIAQYYVGLISPFSPCNTPGPTPDITPTPSPAPTPTATPPPVNVDPDPSMGGFAAVERHGVRTTIGGAGGSTVTVNSFDNLKMHAESDERIIIQVSGTISAPGEHGLVRVLSNKTIIGLGSNAILNKITLSVNGWDRPGEDCDADDYGTFTPSSNVIIRNLEFTGLADFPDDSDVDPDCIRVENYSHHVWIDHNTFQYGADGATDVKRGADMVTISYNHYVHTNKTALIGHSDNTGDQDRGFLNVTFHHNFFDRTETRTPRLRWGYVHVYNNYYDFVTHAFRIGPEG
ncbi:MAG: carbohydrate-binding protein, partial [Acidobacteria bacterium]|nr:carbohydrate-binding protein [Acidobacteriota bacterium]